jgi:hypothetical protein
MKESNTILDKVKVARGCLELCSDQFKKLGIYPETNQYVSKKCDSTHLVEFLTLGGEYGYYTHIA